MRLRKGIAVTGGGAKPGGASHINLWSESRAAMNACSECDGRVGAQFGRQSDFLSLSHMLFRTCVVGVSLSLSGCATKLVDSVVVPVRPDHGFSLRHIPQGTGRTGIYISTTPFQSGFRYGALILEPDGSCLFTFGFDHLPNHAELKSSPGVAARYCVKGTHITIESLDFDPGGRRYSVSEGTIVRDSITIQRAKWRDSTDWQPSHKHFRAYGVSSINRPMPW